MFRKLSLSTQTLLIQLGVIGLVLVVVSAAAFVFLERQLERDYGERSLAIAEAVAHLPAVRDAMDDPAPWNTIQPLAETIRKAAGMSFVVVANDQGIRYSHPVADRVGEPLSTDPSEALAGVSGIYVQEGTLGRSVRGKAPILGPDGAIIGLVSVGVLMSEVHAQIQQRVPLLLLMLGVALLLGGVGSWLLARRVKRQTFGMDPSEMAVLYEHRVAMLLSIREGVLAVGRDGVVHLANEEAKRLLNLPDDVVGSAVDDLPLDGTIRELLRSGSAAGDVVALSRDRVLLVNQRTTEVRGETTGWVLTLRDRTELESVLRELDSVRGVAHALRAQAHEFSNQLHTLAGLIELGRTDEAVDFIIETSSVHQQLAEDLTSRIGDPTVAALLLAKAAVASERGVRFKVADDTACGSALERPRDVITIVGNLVDNALDAVMGAEVFEPAVEVSIRTDTTGTTIRVSDNGPGVPSGLRARIFEEGVTTKGNRDHAYRGVGLALIAQVTQRHGGSIAVSDGPGATFTVVLPKRSADVEERV